MRKSLARLAVFAVLLIAFAVPTGNADYWHGRVDYYPDATYCEPCGYFIRYCNNSYTRYGCETAYSIDTPFNCDIGPE